MTGKTLPQGEIEMTAELTEDRWLKVAEAAGRLGVSPSTLRWWRHKGIGPLGVKIGGQHKYKLSAIRQYEAQQTAEAEQALEWARLRPSA
jgi:predicted site-specific integrase-resolvase